jgi:hypothetical protein
MQPTQRDIERPKPWLKGGTTSELLARIARQKAERIASA